MPDRKFLSEFAVNLYSARWLAIPANQLAADGKMDTAGAEISKRCHVYLICRRPACSFDPASLSYEGGQIAGRLLYRIAGKSSSLPFKFPFELVDGATSVRLSPYPHREIRTIDASGEVVRYVPATSLSLEGRVQNPVLQHLEVLYVGQAYAGGRRNAIDRLRSHATLQKILAEMQHNMPDDEVIIFAFEYVPYRVITMIDGTDKKAISDKRDAERFSSILDNPLSEHQQICLVEAGLIRYFQPRYNEIYKASFPAADQKILDECYRLDFSALIVEIDTEDMRLSLFSENAKPKEHHTVKFDLIDPAARRSFFTFIDRDGKAVAMPNVIPPSRS